MMIASNRYRIPRKSMASIPHRPRASRPSLWVVARNLGMGVLLAGLLSSCSLKTRVTNTGNGILKAVGLQGESEIATPSERLGDLTGSLSLENEYFLGRAVTAKILSVYPVRKDDRVEEYLSYILTVVAEASNRPNTFKGYKIIIIESGEVNAVSAPGGFVLISTGFLERLKNEDELAAVLAHEVAHIEGRHGLRSLSHERLSGAVDALGVVASSFYCGNVVQQALVVLNTAVDEMVQTLLSRGYSRDQEFEADARALAILSRAGYEPSGLTGALHDIEQPGRSRKGGWFSTHPPLQERLARAPVPFDDMLEAPQNPGYTSRHNRFQVIFNRL